MSKQTDVQMIEVSLSQAKRLCTALEQLTEALQRLQVLSNVAATVLGDDSCGNDCMCERCVEQICADLEAQYENTLVGEGLN